MSHRCCSSLLSFTYSYIDKLDGSHQLTRSAADVRKWGHLNRGVTGYAVCSGCGHEPEDFEWETPDEFVSHCETVKDPL